MYSHLAEMDSSMLPSLNFIPYFKWKCHSGATFPNLPVEDAL